MLPKPKNKSQLGFYLTLQDQLNEQHPLYQLANTISWEVFEKEFSKHYSVTQGAPAKPIRLMVSLLILKQLRNLSDESMVEQWSENAYYQYFGGEHYFKPEVPCASTELVEFRKRIGEAGVELILKESIRVNGKDGEDDTLSGDTTIQEKNITYPTDDKLYKKIIVKCQAIATKENIELRQSYTQTIKKLSYLQRMKRLKGGDVQARKANKKVKTIAGRLVREIERKLPADTIQKHGIDVALFKKVLAQKRSDSDKTYSIHEPQVKCYTKGKEHKKFEFGSKASFLITQKTGVIVGALNFTATLHDSKTLPHALEQYERLTGRQPKEIFLDRGYRGPKKIDEINLHTPKPDKNITKTKRKKHSRRAAIEPMIGHLKSDYRMIRNYLKGITGDAINVMLAAAAMNFKRVMNLWKRRQIIFVENLFAILFSVVYFLFPKKLILTF
ncbi:MAG: IS5 family transposase [Chitinophagales bacterium]|nr:IS5 family transposase [Chitinophagales bacterium]